VLLAGGRNFNNDILRAVFRRNPAVSIIRAQDAGLNGVSDEALLRGLQKKTEFS
jgi:hypothetical protein